MKKVFRMATLMMFVLTANPALAASARQDSSGLVVWIFLGFCALIIVAQLLPALLVALGLVKGMAARKEPAEAEVPAGRKH